jgi:hypothetical protein
MLQINTSLPGSPWEPLSWPIRERGMSGPQRQLLSDSRRLRTVSFRRLLRSNSDAPELLSAIARGLLLRRPPSDSPGRFYFARSGLDERSKPSFVQHPLTFGKTKQYFQVIRMAIVLLASGNSTEWTHVVPEGRCCSELTP